MTGATWTCRYCHEVNPDKWDFCSDLACQQPRPAPTGENLYSQYRANRMAAALDGIEQAIEDMPELSPEHYQALQQWLADAKGTSDET